MRVLVACEFGGRVRDAFLRHGHDAWSCDLLPSDTPGPHYQGDVRELLDGDWDLMVAFPPCNHLAASGARWWKDKVSEQAEALAFVQILLDAPIHRIALENPIGKIGSAIRPSDQIIQPWQFGHAETKSTCLWLKNLPHLVPTDVVDGRSDRIYRMPDSGRRRKIRSLTYLGIAEAMAEQWGPGHFIDYATHIDLRSSGMTMPERLSAVSPATPLRMDAGRASPASA